MLASRTCLRAAVRPCLLQHRAPSCRPGIAIHLQSSWYASRIFATTPRHRKDDARARTVQKQEEEKQPTEEKVGPETVVKNKDAAKPETKNDPLLAEQTVSNKEQRKADWAIIKDMSQYLWPKNDFNTKFRVGLSVGLLVGAKVGSFSNSPRRAVLIEYVGSQCTSTILLQEHRRFHEHRFRSCWRDCSERCRRRHIRMYAPIYSQVVSTRTLTTRQTEPRG